VVSWCGARLSVFLIVPADETGQPPVKRLFGATHVARRTTVVRRIFDLSQFIQGNDTYTAETFVGDVDAGWWLDAQ